MIRHLCKLVWNRKRANALTAFQIFISFLIVFITASIAVDNVDKYRRPLGFSYENRWVVAFLRDRRTAIGRRGRSTQPQTGLSGPSVIRLA